MGYTELSQLPAKEAAIWEAAHVGDDGKKRKVTRQYAGLNCTGWATAEEFLEEATDRLARWREGRYEIIEAAQIVADSNSQVNAVEFRKQMEKAAQLGELTIRKNGIPISATELENRQIWNTPIRQTDANKWLQSIDAGLELTYPYAGDNAQPQAVPVEAAPEWEAPDPKRRLDALLALGGTIKHRDGEWRFTGMTALVKSEKGRKRSDEKTIRGDLKEAAQAERDEKQAGVFLNGLGHRSR